MPTLEAEVGRLARAAVPVLAEHPLPIRRRRLGEALAAATGGLAAGVVELDELAVVVTDGVAAPTVPGAGVAFLVAFVLELWIAVSVRVHQIEAAGRTVDRDSLVSEVNTAVLDVDARDGQKLAGGIAKAIGKRLARRWIAGLAPGVGIVVDGEAARRTVGRIWQLPLASHPLRARELAVGADQ